MKFSFRNNILLFFALLSFGIIVLGIGTTKNNAKYKDTVYWVEHTQQVLYETEQVLSSASDMESSMRGYALTDNAEFLSPFIDTKKWYLIICRS